MQQRLGVALIMVGLLLIVLPGTGLLRGATVYLIPPNEVWYYWYPQGTQNQPATFNPGESIPVYADVRKYTSGWSLPGSCTEWKLVAVVRGPNSNTVARNITWPLLIPDDYMPEICSTAASSITLSQQGSYTISWRLAVFEGNRFIGYVENPQQSNILIEDAPDGYFTINGIRADPSTTLITQSPLNFVFTATKNADRITQVKIVVRKTDGNQIASLTLAKTGTTQWSGSWTTDTKGRIVVEGYIQTAGNSYQKLSILMDMGGGDTGGGTSGMSVLQLIGFLSVIAGVVMVIRRRR
ncbi:MAG: hypothetical protein QXW52_08735 [Candidatus Caldarchaeum sp.]